MEDQLLKNGTIHTHTPTGYARKERRRYKEKQKSRHFDSRESELENTRVICMPNSSRREILKMHTIEVSLVSKPHGQGLVTSPIVDMSRHRTSDQLLQRQAATSIQRQLQPATSTGSPHIILKNLDMASRLRAHLLSLPSNKYMRGKQWNDRD